MNWLHRPEMANVRLQNKQELPAQIENLTHDQVMQKMKTVKARLARREQADLKYLDSTMKDEFAAAAATNDDTPDALKHPASKGDMERAAKGWKRTSFKVRGDDMPFERKAVIKGDATEYNVHTFTVKSAIAQEITVSARAFGITKKSKDGSQVLLQRVGDKNMVTPGASKEQVVKVAAGEEIEFQVYTKFADDDKMPHDWSLVTWAERMPVRITHKGGLQSSRHGRPGRKLDHVPEGEFDPFTIAYILQD